MAAILGAVRAFLSAMPFLRAFTDQMLLFVRQNTKIGWDTKIPVPEKLKSEVIEIKPLMTSWKGRQFQGMNP